MIISNAKFFTKNIKKKLRVTNEIKKKDVCYLYIKQNVSLELLATEKSQNYNEIVAM